MRPRVQSFIGCFTIVMLASISVSIAAQTNKTFLVQKDQEWALRQIALVATSAQKCEQRILLSVQVSVAPAPAIRKLRKTPLNADWTERWTVDECGVSSEYSLRFTTNKRGDLQAQIVPGNKGPGDN
jgi:hypothetical protein